MARKTKEEALETRLSILNAAIEVFHEQGVAKSTLEEIAEVAGVTRGAVYWHFKNKLDIFSALHDQMHVSVMEDLTQLSATSSSEPLKDLENFAVSFLNLLISDPQHKKLFSLFTLKCDYSDEMLPFLNEQAGKKSQSLKETKSFFEAARQKNQISADSDVHLLSVSFFCYICGITAEFLRNPEMVDLKKNAPALIAQFFKKL